MAKKPDTFQVRTAAAVRLKDKASSATAHHKS